MSRPKEKPLQTEGRFTYTRLGSRMICFPSDIVVDDELELIKAINYAYDKNNAQILTGEQHMRLQRILKYYLVT